MASKSSAVLSSTPGLGDELRRLSRLLTASLSARLDRDFELTETGAARRRALTVSSALLFCVAAFALHTALRWRLGTAAAIPLDAGTLLPDAWLTVSRILLLLGIAVSISSHIAGRFIADIFELRDARVAWKFITRLAAGARYEVLHLREGRMLEKDSTSPIVQIGGPGIVVADYDTAALFEKPDGTAHVVGATPGGAGILLEGFERLREPVIDLRDQYLGDPSGEPLTVVGRSLDGLPVSVTDVRGVFSVRRDSSTEREERSVERPFPFRARDIERLIYRQAVPVLASGEHASGTPGDWTEVMPQLIRESLREFMGGNRLGEFMAGVGPNEVERAEFRADTILSTALQVTPEVPGLPAAEKVTTTRFRPRTELSGKFRKHGSEFSTRAQEFGLELHWIGVGTWKIPDQGSEDVVSSKHVEAWSMNRENLARLQSQALGKVTEEALLEHKLKLIHEVPLARHARNKARYSDKLILMECLLEDFWEQLADALEMLYRAGKPSAEVDELEEAVGKLERLLRISQMGQVIGGGSMSRLRKREEWDRSVDGPPAPASRLEAQQYQALLSKLKGDYRVAEAMISNEKRRHDGLSREQLISRIVARFERHGR